MTASNEWGRVDADGTVFVRTAAGERAVGSWHAGTPEDGLAHYVRRYDDLATEVGLLESRLASGAGDPKTTLSQAAALQGSLADAAVVGDVAALDERLTALAIAAQGKLEQAGVARAAARAAAAAAPEKLVLEAEELAQSSQWKATGDRFRAIVEEWQAIKGVDRKADEALWKRFAAARDAFFAARAATFSERDAEQLANQRVKEALIAEAEALDPAADLKVAQARLRDIQERYDAAGHVPRDSIRTLDNRMRAAEQRVRDAGEAEWKRAKPDSNPLLDQLRDTVAKAETQLAKARAGGSAAKIAEAEAAVDARREWLAEAERSVRR